MMVILFCSLGVILMWLWEEVNTVFTYASILTERQSSISETIFKIVIFFNLNQISSQNDFCMLV